MAVAISEWVVKKLFCPYLNISGKNHLFERTI